MITHLHYEDWIYIGYRKVLTCYCCVLLQTPNIEMQPEPSEQPEDSGNSTASFQQTPNIEMQPEPSEQPEDSGNSTASFQQTPNIEMQPEPSEQPEDSGNSTASFQQTPNIEMQPEPSEQPEDSGNSTASFQQTPNIEMQSEPSEQPQDYGKISNSKNLKKISNSTQVQELRLVGPRGLHLTQTPWARLTAVLPRHLPWITWISVALNQEMEHHESSLLRRL
ncbi:protein TsetseEP-like isoform X2 [Parambassis ranga]|uniref:Protein TsetseEP-like isoform X2 n=1 Tax=Parambassis ranga TaxID=210632 RepID=A0A6P7JRP8_9TELE|nr:protein TsetseEP-like isoform X2 [Parambassis ranga]